MDDEELKEEIHQQGIIAKMLLHKFTVLDSLEKDDLEVLAFRLAEIFVAAKNLYTRDLDRLSSVLDDKNEEMWDTIMVTRMQLLHLRDLVDEFDEAFMRAMK